MLLGVLFLMGGCEALICNLFKCLEKVNDACEVNTQLSLTSKAIFFSQGLNDTMALRPKRLLQNHGDQ